MRQPGVEVRPLKQMTGSSEFCEVFMTGARVEKENQIGRLGEGWAIANTTLGYERGGRSLARISGYASQYHHLVGAARRLQRHGKPLIESPLIRQKLGKIWADLEVERYNALRILTQLEKGEHPGAGGSLTKLSYSEFEKRFMEVGPGDPRALWPAHRRRAAGAGAGDRHRGRRPGHLGLRLPVVAGGHHLRGLLRDPEERHRRAHSRPAQGDARRSRGSRAMNFAFSDDQTLLKNSARALLDEHCKPEHVRAMQEDARGYGEGLWGEMAKLGWLGLPFPEQYGGAGLGLVELALLHEEMGRVAYPGPFLATVVLGGLPLLLGGSAAQKEKWLPAIASGRARLTAAFQEESLDWDPASIAATAARAGAGWTISGVKRFVPWAQAADAVLVPARTPKASHSSWWTRQARRGDASPHHRHGSDHPVVPRSRSAASPSAPTRWWARREAVARCWTRRSAAPPSAPPRKCWARRGARSTWRSAMPRCASSSGSSIGTFQAIRHKCAEMLMEVENSHSAVYYAAWALEAGAEDATVAASVCKSYVSESARRVCGEAIQVHGGIGFTWEYDLHLYFKRAKSLEVQFGDAEYHRELIAKHVASSHDLRRARRYHRRRSHVVHRRLLRGDDAGRPRGRRDQGGGPGGRQLSRAARLLRLEPGQALHRGEPQGAGRPRARPSPRPARRRGHGEHAARACATGWAWATRPSARSTLA